MPSPSGITEMTAMIRRSGLIESDIIDDFVSRTERDIGAIGSPTAFLADLVQNAILTTFQASQFALGRWRGFVVGPYKLLDRIGKGAMGRVYLAAKPGGCPVAIKVLDSHLMTDDTSMRRFVREATSAAALDHPNVVRILDMDLSAQPPYLVMEYVDGPTLQAAVARGGVSRRRRRPSAVGKRALDSKRPPRPGWSTGMSNRRTLPSLLPGS